MNALSTIRKTVLSVRDLRVTLELPAGRLQAVSGIDMEVGAGETLCIVGESGSGKTMTALALMQLLPRAARMSAERIELGGQDIAKLDRRAFAALRGDRIAMIFQDPMTSLNPVYRLGDQLEEVFLRHGKGTRQQARDRAVHLLSRVGVRDAAHRLRQYPFQLSGGLRQRFMIAMALMCEPDVLVADEPTTALDVTTQARTLALLKKLQAEFGTAIVFITHDLGVVARIADRVNIMYAGKVVETASVKQLFGNPTHPYTRGLLECLPSRAEPGQEMLGSIPGRVPSLIGEQRGCLFRNRCARALPDCATQPVPFRSAAQGHDYRCLLSTGKLAEGVS